VKKVLQEFDKDDDIVVVCDMVYLFPSIFYQASQEQHYSHKPRVQVKNTFFDWKQIICDVRDLQCVLLRDTDYNESVLQKILTL
jgi:hypothetical protein